MFRVPRFRRCWIFTSRNAQPETRTSRAAETSTATSDGMPIGPTAAPSRPYAGSLLKPPSTRRARRAAVRSRRVVVRDRQ